jgi:hypothetical protein
LVDPSSDEFDLLLVERLADVGWRHDGIGIGAEDSRDDFALLGLVWDDGKFAALRSSPCRCWASGPWHWKQCSERMGRISRLKEIASCACEWWF